MKRSIERRKFLKFGSLGIAGLAGCSSNNETVNAPSTTEPTETEQPTSDGTVSESSTTETAETERPTETPDSLDVLEHNNLVGAHYYAWYRGEDGFSAQGVGGSQPNGWVSQTPGEPELGAYDSQNPDVIDQHMRWSLEHGINWWIITVGGRGTATRQAITDVIFEAELADQMSFTILTGFVPSQQTENSRYNLDDASIQESLRQFISSWKREFASDSNYLYLDGRPTLYFWDSNGYIGDVVSVFEDVFEQEQVDPYVIGGPNYYSQPTVMGDKHEVYDAILDYHGIYPDEEYMNNYREFIVDRHRRWRIAADTFDLDFIPTVTPGFDTSERTSEIGSGAFSTFLDREPAAFRSECRSLNGFGDKNATVVTSFNEWPEYSVVEPTVSEGTTFLEIISEELTSQTDKSVNTDEYSRIGIEFNETVTPSSGDARELAFMCRSLRLESDAGTIELDVGSVDESYICLSGAYSSESDPKSTFRWFGGPNSKTELVVNENNIDQIAFSGRAIAEDLQATISVEGGEIGIVEFGQSDSVYSTA